MVQNEMEMWWERHTTESKIELGGYTKSEVEDFTGRIPLLLESCLVDGKINLGVETIRRTGCLEASCFIYSSEERNGE